LNATASITYFSAEQRIRGTDASHSPKGDGIEASGDHHRGNDQKNILCVISKDRIPHGSYIIKEANLRVMIGRSD
jgi:hypothetical protein